MIEKLLLQLNHLHGWQIGFIATYFLLQGFVFTLFPEEIITMTLGLLWGQGRIDLHQALICIWLGLLPANALTAYLGSRLGTRIFSIRPFSWFFKQDGIEASLLQVRKHGRWVVFLTRFIPLVRGPVYFSAGMSQMGVLRFIRTDFLASCIQLPALLFLGRWMGKEANSLFDAYQRIGVIMVGLIISFVLFKFINSWISFKRTTPKPSIETETP